MRRLIALLLVLSITPAINGCGPSVSNKDMGTILDKIPHVQGADKPYELPKIILPSEETFILNSLDNEGTKTGQVEGEKDQEPEQQATPDSTKRPKPTPARHRP
jgi:hypothetical protein